MEILVPQYKPLDGDYQEKHLQRVLDAVAKGGCPKCGCMTTFDARDPVDSALRLCHSCGNKFLIETGEKES